MDFCHAKAVYNLSTNGTAYCLGFCILTSCKYRTNPIGKKIPLISSRDQFQPINQLNIMYRKSFSSLMWNENKQTN